MAITFNSEDKSYSDGITTLALNNGVYEINTVNQLKLFRDAVNEGYNFKGETVKLTASIDLSNGGTEEWTPIGTQSNPFAGTFDGGNTDGYTVSNLVIKTSDQNNVGFFGEITEPAVITNLTIENVNIAGAESVGAIAGSTFKGEEISNCKVTGTIQISGTKYVGGICGYGGYLNLIDSCSVSGTDGSAISASGHSSGGICGFRAEGSNGTDGNMKTLNSSVSNIAISAEARVGGISSIAHYWNTIEGCSVENVTITAENDNGTTGLIAGANQGEKRVRLLFC